MSADTVVPGSGFDPRMLNRFSYVRNNPLCFVDSSGHYVEEVGPGNHTSDEDLQRDITDRIESGRGFDGDRNRSDHPTLKDRIETYNLYFWAKAELSGYPYRSTPPEVKKSLDFSSSLLGQHYSTEFMNQNGEWWRDDTTKISPTLTALGFSFDLKGKLEDWPEIEALGDTAFTFGHSRHLSFSLSPGTGQFSLNIGWGVGSPVDVGKTIDTITYDY